jgi:UDP-glucose 4-epimerase
MLADFEQAHGIRWMSLRYFNAAGCDPAGETGEWHDPETHLIPRALMAAVGRIPRLEIFGHDYPTPDGTCIRDYVHVMDLANAHVMGMNFLAEGGRSQAMNLGTGQAFHSRGTGCSTRAHRLGRTLHHVHQKTWGPSGAGC